MMNWLRIISCVLLVGLSDQQPVQVLVDPVTGCTDEMNLVLVVDASENVPGYFSDAKLAVRDFVTNTFDNNPAINIGIVFYTNQQNIPNGQIFELSGAGSRIQMLDFIQFQSMSNNPVTRTDLGINQAVTMLQADGLVGLGSIIVVTDGPSQLVQMTAGSAANARALGLRMFGVGYISDTATIDELRSLSLDEDMVFTTVLGSLTNIMVQLSNSICAYSVCTSCTVDEGSRRAAHPVRCDKFYICERREGQMSRAFLKDCPIGTLWHKRYMTCMKAADVLASPFGGCDYCKGTRQTYRVNDYCQIYYRCGTTPSGGPTLDINCCPSSQGYDFNVGVCQTNTGCVARRYDNSASCRKYFACEGLTGQIWNSNCCNNNYYNSSSQQCEDNSNCKGDCDSATYRHCDNFQPHSDQCKFYSVIGTTFTEMSCANLTSWSSSECQCVHNVSCVTLLDDTCRPDVEILVTPDQEISTGFQESSQRKRYIDVKRVIYNNGNIVLNGKRNFITVPYFSNNDQAFMKNTVLFRVNVKDDYVNGLPNTDKLVVLSNFPCEATNSEAGLDASVEISYTPSTGTVNFKVRVTTSSPWAANPIIQEARVQLQYSTFLGEDVWKRMTIRYTQYPGLLEAQVLAYSVNADRSRNILDEQTGSTSEDVANTSLAGRILTSSDAFRVGKGSNEDFTFRGRIDDVLFYDLCKQGVPAVGDDSPRTSITT